MSKKILCAAAASLIALPGVSQAEFNYTWVELSFVDVEFDTGPASIDGDGFSISGAYTVADQFFVGGSYQTADYDFGVDGDVTRITGGYFHPLNEDLDFIATLSYVDAEVGTGPFSAGDDGLALGGGVRVALSDRFEVDALVEFVDMDLGGSDTGVEVLGRYYFTEDIAVAAQVDLNKDIETFRIGVRFDF
jgi:opacity protein-like surface antigen